MRPAGLRLLTCSLCEREYALWPSDKDGYKSLFWSESLDAPVHPACVEAYVNQHRLVHGDDFSPLLRLLGFESIERDFREYRRKQFEHCRR